MPGGEEVIKLFRATTRQGSRPAFLLAPPAAHALGAKREKVFQEIRRPVFSLLEKGPLAESCTYLSYDSLRKLAAQKHLTHLSDTVLDEYTEEVELS